MKTTIFQKILAATLIPAILIFSLMLTFIYSVSIKTSKENAENIVENFTYYAAETSYNALRNYEIELQFLSRYISNILNNISESEEIVSQVLEEIIEADASLDSAWAVFEPGIIKETRIIKSVERHGDTFVFDNAFTDDILDDPVLGEWYRMPAKEGKVYFDPLDLYDDGVDDNIENRPFYNCDISFPIWNGNKIIGAVGFDFLYSSLFNTIENIRTDMQSAVILLSDDMTIMYATDKELQGKNFISTAEKRNGKEKMQEIAEALARKESYSTNFFSLLLGKPGLFCVVPVSIDRAESTIYLYTVTPDDILYKATDDMTRTILSISIVGLIILAACVFFASKKIAVPIRDFTETANKIANGDFNVDFGEDDYGGKKINDELVKLKISLEKMVIQLKQAHEADVRRVEAELEKERVQASSDAKSIFFANMSHEIRTPMNSILGITQIMLYENNLTEKQRKYINDIRVSSDALLGIINDILDLSKLESGKMSLFPINFNFKQFIDNVVSLGVFLAEQKKLDFRIFTVGETPVCLYGDDTRLRQVLVNIISNAVKFTQHGFISLSVIVKEKEICFEIKDTGIGIKPENMPNLFYAFEQVKEKDTRSSEGTGLGLSICKNLIDVMGGEISVESEYGKGSTFRVTIPRTDGDETKLSENKNDGSKVYFSPESKILIVDDNEINLHVANGLIETLFGIDCDLAQSGAEAISLIAGTDYDIVFMDHMMPEMDGIETTKRLREQGNKDLVIIALTANAVVGTKAMFIQAGMNDFLSKPIDKNELENMLLKWLPKEKRVINKSNAKRFKAKPEYTEIISKAEKLLGLDVSAGLSNVANNQEVYEKSLQILNSKIPVIVLLLPALVEEENYKDFTIHVHGIKSSLASLGAMSLSKQAFKLEKASKDNDIKYCREMMPVFVKRLDKFGKQLAEIFGSTITAGDKKPADKDDFLRMAEYLKGCVEEYDYENGTAIIREMDEYDYGEELNGWLVKIKQSMEAFDYSSVNKYISDLFIKVKI